MSVSLLHRICEFLHVRRSIALGQRSLRPLATIAASVAFCLAFSAVGLHAQGYGTISGLVTDPSGAVIPSAILTATQTVSGTTMKAVSGGDGRYVFPTLLPAPYSLSVSAAGFETYRQTGIVLDADQALTVNITMRVGAQTQTVSVTADAPQVDTTTGTLSQVIDQSTVQDMPLNGRAAATLITRC